VALHASTGVITIHGPQLIPHFGRPRGPNPDTLAAWRRLVMEPSTAPQPIPWPARYEEKLPVWESAADQRGKRDLRPNPPPLVDRPAEVEGELLAGNLATLQVLAGTRWWPDFGDCILAWEEVREDFAAIERSLWHLRETGACDRMAGMVVGKPLGCHGRPGETFEGIVRDALDGLDFPVAFHHDFGHREPFLAMPVGCRALLDEEGKLTLLEPAVSDGHRVRARPRVRRPAPSAARRGRG
jgi:muramoyltetrapeptide carboxypeptidase